MNEAAPKPTISEAQPLDRLEAALRQGEAAAGAAASPEGPSGGAGAPEGQASDGPTTGWVRPAETPTQHGPDGVRFDFNSGAQLLLPKGGAPWKVRISDLDTGNILFQTRIEGGRVSTSKRYYVRVRLEIEREGEAPFVHDYDAAGKEVLINFPGGTLGDAVGWMTYAARFQAAHQCRLTCAMVPALIPIFRDAYPEIAFLEHKDVEPERFYASYYVGLFFNDVECVHQPCDFRLVGLHRTAGYILGVDPQEEPPRVAFPDEGRPIADRYVCIATQSTSQAKYWNNPHGWREVIKLLKDSGYRVICVDQKPVHGLGLVWNHLPHGAEDRTGLSLQDCARWLKHADFFVGLSSGLSWLAWAVGARVVLISGFSHPTTEFDTPYRVINYHSCNSCWNDPALRFDHKDFLWCPRHKNTPRQFECTRLITAEHVKRVIGRVVSPKGIEP